MTAGESRPPRIRIQIEVEGPPGEAAKNIVQRLGDKLREIGVRGEFVPGGVLMEGDVTLGQAESLPNSQGLSITLKPFPYSEAPSSRIEMRFETGPLGTTMSLELEGWAETLKAVNLQVADWTSSVFLPAVLWSVSPSHLLDWHLDSKARRPSGQEAIETYRNPTYHWPSFLLILDWLRLTPSDRLIEVGCGGGAFLRKALESGCNAVGVDHSPEMVRTARSENASSIAQGRLSVFEGDVEQLPVESDSFTTCVCANAFFFFPDPGAALKEMGRVLRPGGRLALVTETPKARGTPAAPEPFATHSLFYEPRELAELARSAGFTDVRVEEPDLEPYARSLGLSEEVIAVFTGKGGTAFLTAAKPPLPGLSVAPNT